MWLNILREGKVIVEKYIEGPEVSVNGYMVNGVMRFLIVSDRGYLAGIYRVDT